MDAETDTDIINARIIAANRAENVDIKLQGFASVSVVVAPHPVEVDESGRSFVVAS